MWYIIPKNLSKHGIHMIPPPVAIFCEAARKGTLEAETSQLAELQRLAPVVRLWCERWELPYELYNY